MWFSVWPRSPYLEEVLTSLIDVVMLDGIRALFSFPLTFRFLLLLSFTVLIWASLFPAVPDMIQYRTVV